MGPRLARVACFLIAVAALPASSWAQSSIAGLVTDTSGAVLPGVTVEVSSPALIEKARVATTDSEGRDRKSTRLNSSHSQISYAVFCLKKKTRQCQSHSMFVCYLSATEARIYCPSGEHNDRLSLMVGIDDLLPTCNPDPAQLDLTSYSS